MKTQYENKAQLSARAFNYPEGNAVPEDVARKISRLATERTERKQARRQDNEDR